MSDGYNARLAPGIPKGRVGMREVRERKSMVRTKALRLAKLIHAAAGNVVVFSGAGISTSCGIPDFRGPTGVWTLEKKGQSPPEGIKFATARPSATHMAIAELVKCGMVRSVVTQNVDSLHLKSGVPESKLCELHGNVFAESCDSCDYRLIHVADIGGMGLRATGGRRCPRCKGALYDECLDWDSALPDDHLKRAIEAHREAQLVLVLGSSLQIRPARSLPLKTIRHGGKLAIINLQATPLDEHATIRIGAPVDSVFELIMQELNLTIPAYETDETPHKCRCCRQSECSLVRVDIDRTQWKDKHAERFMPCHHTCIDETCEDECSHLCSEACAAQNKSSSAVPLRQRTVRPSQKRSIETGQDFFSDEEEEQILGHVVESSDSDADADTSSSDSRDDDESDYEPPVKKRRRGVTQ
ncbi:MAG: hypothetical protein MHM6MM_004340 [Cercozoa sp. M6MM]